MSIPFDVVGDGEPLLLLAGRDVVGPLAGPTAAAAVLAHLAAHHLPNAPAAKSGSY